jgi:hypothetical protein
MRGMLAFSALLLAGQAGAEVLAHRLDSLSLAGESMRSARVVQGDLRAETLRGSLRRA